MSTPSNTSPTSSPLAATTAPTKIQISKKPKSARKNHPIKRRGAKVEEDEEGTRSKPLAVVGSDSEQSDFEPAALDDEDDNDAGSESDEGTNDPLTPATLSPSATPVPNDPAPDSITPLPNSKSSVIPPTAIHPSWSDPILGDAEELPVLDFATLTSTTLAGVPKRAPKPNSRDTPPSISTPTIPSTNQTKKAAVLAKKIAKSMEAKAKDPVAWEIAEKERLDREALKKKEKNLRSKEKRKEKLNAEHGVAASTSTPASTSSTTATLVPAVAVIAMPSSSTPQAPVTAPTAPRIPTGPRSAVPSKPSRTSVALANTPPHQPVASSSTLPPARPRSGQPPSDQFVNARDAYTNRLADDASYTPRVGKFWSHDERLMEPELRGLTPYWRGRGRGGELRGGGRGASRGGRGGYVLGRGGIPVNASRVAADAAAKEEEVVAIPVVNKKKSRGNPDDEEDDGWGRGEGDRTTKNIINSQLLAAASDWNHDGFEELKNAEPRSASASEQRGKGNGYPRGGGRGGRNGAGYSSEPGTPGAVNPRFAHLPFHPSHRFPALPVAASSPTPLPLSTTPLVTPTAPIVPVVIAPVVEKLPAAEAPKVVELVAPVSLVVPVVPISQPPQPLQSQPPPPVILQSLPPANFIHQLPPHLQPQPNYAIPRHGSPVYYPQYYSADTAPPALPYPSPLPASTFFVPPRSSKVEIKVPGPSHSPANNSSASASIAAAQMASAARASPAPSSIPVRAPNPYVMGESPRSPMIPVVYGAYDHVNGGGGGGMVMMDPQSGVGYVERGGAAYYNQSAPPLQLHHQQQHQPSQQVYYSYSPQPQIQQQQQFYQSQPPPPLQEQRHPSPYPPPPPIISDPAILSMSTHNQSNPNFPPHSNPNASSSSREQQERSQLLLIQQQFYQSREMPDMASQAQHQLSQSQHFHHQQQQQLQYQPQQQQYPPY
jgi:hypothetical protein